MSEAKVLRMSWGNKPCEHPFLEIERDEIGTSTGDYVCTTCGQARLGSDWNDPKHENTKNIGTNSNVTPNP